MTAATLTVITTAGTSVNWSAATRHSGAAAQLEVTLSGSGRKAGAAKTATATASVRSMPSLCKAAMLQRWHALRAASQASCATDAADSEAEGCDACADSGRPGYGAVKSAAGGGWYARSWAALRREPSPFACWVPKPQQHEKFPV